LERHSAHPESIEPETIDETRRTFSGREGVLGAVGVYRAAFASMTQSDPLMDTKVRTPISAMGGDKGQGANVGQDIRLVAARVEAHTLANCGHFLPQERPREIVEQIVTVTQRG
jgi:pimeloyl-ACP methyl ester carboxylesterase